MPIHATQRSFNAGMLTAWMDSRADVDKWRSGVKSLKNFLITPYGGIRRRMGTQFVAVTKFNGSRKCRVLGFQASTEEGYCLEIGHLYMRFHRNGETIMDGLLPLELVTPWTEDQIFQIQWEVINDIAFMVQGDNPVQNLKHFAANDWEITPMSFDWPAAMDENTTSTTLSITDVTNVPVVTTVPFIINSPGAADQESQSLLASGAYTATINTLAIDPIGSIDPTLLLQRSTDNGQTWTTLTNITTTGVYSGTTTGLIRLKANFYTVNSTISTTVNNPSISVGDAITVGSSSPLFSADSVGRFYSIGHFRSTTEFTIPLYSSGLSGPFPVFGKWTLSTTGTWSGTIYVDQSKDDGATWQPILTRFGAANRNINETQEVEEPVLLRLRFISFAGGSNNPFATLSVPDAIVEGVFRITAYISPSSVSAVVVKPFISQAATTIWRAGAWSKESGYPQTVQWHANRMVFGGTKKQGAYIWFSRVEDYYYFRPGTNDDDSFYRQLGGTQQENIQWICSLGDLAIGTGGGEWSGTNGDEAGIVTPTSFTLRRQSGNGGEGVMAVVANNVVLYVQKTGRKLREFAYDLQQNGYDGADLTQLSIDVTIGGIRDTAMQRQRDQTFWATTYSGKAIPLIYERGQAVVGWGIHETQGEFESVCAVYEEGEEDTLYYVVQREVNGDPVRYIERTVPNQFDLIENGSLSDMPFMDSFVTYDGTTTSPGFTNYADFKLALDSTLVFSSILNTNGYSAIQAACDQINWNPDPTVTKVILMFVDTPNTGLPTDPIPVLASLNDNGIVFHTGPNFPGTNYNNFATITGGQILAEIDINSTAKMLSKITSLFTPNDKLQFCVIVDTLATPADAINFQIIMSSFKAAMDGIHANLLTKFDEIGYSLITMNNVGFTFATTASATTESIIGGLGHLIGKTVQIMADGVDIGDQVVDGAGTVTLPEAAAKVHVGLGYESDVETLPMSVQLRDGDSDGRLKRISNVDMRVLRSVNASIAPLINYTGSWEPLSYSNRTGVDYDPVPSENQIGELENWHFVMPMGHSKDPRIAVRQTRPLPLNILSITATYDVTAK